MVPPEVRPKKGSNELEHWKSENCQENGNWYRESELVSENNERKIHPTECCVRNTARLEI
jgi:hypothetical protein